MFQVATRVNSITVTMPGPSRRMATCQKIRTSPAPSTRAASMSESGTASAAYTRMRNTLNGLTSDGRMTAHGVLVMPADENSR